MKNLISCLIMGVAMLPVVSTLAENADGEKFILRTAVTCPLANGKDAVLKIKTSGQSGAGWSSPVILINDKPENLDKFVLPGTGNMGMVDIYRCIHGALMVTWESSPYIDGVVIRANPKTYAIERLDFSEKNFPEWIYMDDGKMIIFIGNPFYSKSEKYSQSGNEKKYIIYRYISGKGALDEADRTQQTNQLSTPRKYLYRIR